MYRVTISGHNIYAKEINSDDEPSLMRWTSDVEALIENGDPVIIVNEIEDLREIGIDPDAENLHILEGEET